MEISISDQLYQVAVALLVGAMFGFFYDLLRAVRRRARLGFIAVVSDTVFWIVVGFAVFIMSMVVGKGEVRIFMLMCTVAGAVLYFAALSKYTLNVCNAILDGIVYILRLFARPFVFMGKKIKKFLRKAKKYFKKFTKCGTIAVYRAKKNSERRVPIHNAVGDEQIESKKGRYIYQNSYSGDHRVRRGNAYKTAESDKGRTGKSGSSGNKNRRDHSRKRRHGI